MLKFMQFRSENCLSYILSDSSSREAIVVDPSMDSMDGYRAYIGENDLRVISAVDLQTHLGHYSATHLFKKEFPSSSIVMSVHTESARATVKLREGDPLVMGTLKFKILDIQGCAPDAIAFVGEGLILTGETLLIGRTGETIYPGADTEVFYRSLKKLETLPGSTLVYPGQDQTDLLCTSIQTEWLRNSELKLSQSEFILKKSATLRFAFDDQSQSCRDFNLALDPNFSKVKRLPRNEARLQTPEGARASSISVEKYDTKLKHHSTTTFDTAFIDVREPEEFAAGHIPGVENIPLARVPFEFEKLSRFSRVYLSCLSGRRSDRAAATLCYMGLKDVVNVSGGYKAWVNQGLPIVK